ncbi:MAG: hypothetical protein CFH32_00081 [Alphaproteobacteria bacterium MarineAlpha9_Bin2]|nr:MAG: hypothetical protein CFH31_01433 [Alphaproteobacteria bacterium MarineAlpha9_Bin1]PPR31473.1 MAG: hypothetical protein CFH32_00081 [Alphaproteobacteria bacterium MarineAlpha9_Bin2]
MPIKKQEKKIDPKLLKILACPVTKSELVYNQNSSELISKQAGLAFPVKNGIPIMLIEKARKIKN